MSAKKGTILAPPQRGSGEDVRPTAGIAESNPILSEILRVFGGVVVVLDERRRIVGVNTAALKMLGVEDPQSLLGLRPGEALACVHAEEAPSGCGTGVACQSCGAALAILGSQKSRVPCEAECLLHARVGGREISKEYLARAVAVDCDERRLTVLMLQDISDTKRRETYERTFLNDLRNAVTILSAGVDRLHTSEHMDEVKALVEHIRELTLRLSADVDTQRDLLRAECGDYQTAFEDVYPAQVVEEVRRTFGSHDLLRDRVLKVNPGNPDVKLRTSRTLLPRVLSNMVLNALEATPSGGIARLRWEPSREGATFMVWNQGSIPDEVAPRIFDRYFTTKDGPGRGLGAYSMRLFAEKCLGGKIDFVSSQQDGTLFRLFLPNRPNGNNRVG
jgi:K+-sensing histidine kinase KdpD